MDNQYQKVSVCVFTLTEKQSKLREQQQMENSKMKAPINKLHDLVDTLDYLNKHGLLGDDTETREAISEIATATEHLLDDLLDDLRYMAAKCDESVGVDGSWLIPHLQAIGEWGEDL